MLKIEWIYDNPSGNSPVGIRELVIALADAPHESVFSTDLVIILCEYFWRRYYKTIVKFALLPWVFYFLLVLFYMSYFAVSSSESHSDEEEFFKQLTRILIVILMIYMEFFEVVSMCRDKLSYFRDPFNVVDVCSHSLNLYCILHTPGPESAIR